MDLQLTKFCSRFEESLYSEESLSITTYFVFGFLRHDPAGAHIKKDLLKQHIPYNLPYLLDKPP